ncbi:MAG: sigma-54 dependent transcriptional regulator [Cytophagales bacterium]|nr:sigma-54 dependent transcriptional regulator [Cytophagales bacterium]
MGGKRINEKNLQQVKEQFGIVGHAHGLVSAVENAIKVAHTDLNVLITGESGTGKESFSKIIHHLSKRKHEPFIVLNCGAIPEGTLDSELFGHEKGAFTGAHQSRKGYFEVADKGTLFLDEIAEMTLATQARLLRVLEYHEFFKVGSSQVLKSHARVVAATHVPLQEHIKEKKFREDLYYRLSTVPISIPPLRTRKEDIMLLFKRFAHDTAEKYKSQPITLNGKAQERLENYEFPGNIRQLKNIVEQISVLETIRTIDEQTLKKYLPIPEKTAAVQSINKQETHTQQELMYMYRILFGMKDEINGLKTMIYKILEEHKNPKLIREHQELFQKQEKNKPDTHNIPTIKELPTTNVRIEKIEEPTKNRENKITTPSLENIEKEFIRKVLIKHQNRKKEAAQELGISERTLYRKLQRFEDKKEPSV